MKKTKEDLLKEKFIAWQSDPRNPKKYAGYLAECKKMRRFVVKPASRFVALTKENLRTAMLTKERWKQMGWRLRALLGKRSRRAKPKGEPTAKQKRNMRGVPLERKITRLKDPTRRMKVR